MRGGRAAMAALLVGGLALAGCAADPNTFYPDTESGQKLLEQRARENVPARYRPTEVTIVREIGRHSGGGFGAAWSGVSVGSGLGDTDVVGYNAWVRRILIDPLRRMLPGLPPDGSFLSRRRRSADKSGASRFRGERRGDH